MKKIMTKQAIALLMSLLHVLPIMPTNYVVAENSTDNAIGASTLEPVQEDLINDTKEVIFTNTDCVESNENDDTDILSEESGEEENADSQASETDETVEDNAEITEAIATARPYEVVDILPSKLLAAETLSARHHPHIRTETCIS